MALHYSKYFNVAHKEFERLGVYDGYLNKDNLEYVKNKLAEIQKDMKENDEYIPEIVAVNGLRQPSASVSSYKDSTI